ncbi:MAG: hypothetical protein Q4F56_02205 [Candidatus Saccharibacteria bacterium]|nr:hypothetical protein [Candidatus Saccharibacteria bacterium]
MDEGLEGGTRLSALLRNKKVVLIVLAVLLVVAGGGFLLWRSLSSGNGGQLFGMDSIRSSFNEYANYLLNGEKSTIDIGEIGDFEESYFGRAIMNEETQIDYYVNLKDYYENFLNNVNERNDENKYDGGFLDSYGIRLNFVVTYYTEDSLTFDSILGAYSKGGEAAAKDLIEERAKVYDSFGQIYDFYYQDLLKDWANGILASIAYYDGLGCLGADEVNYDCVMERGNDEAEEILETTSDSDYYVNNVLELSERSLYEQLFEIKTLVYAGGVTGGEENG